ncbi:MAG: alcohol dehydrogenase catalytic domain-containing protein [Candidatus Hydrogenedentota bacterium]|nr:MAG: alcohol dehydrogenase catalytic domain-containing protein [Candidatus Hydrogenedentota bacterium]
MKTMKAMAYRGVGKIVLEEVPRPGLIEPTDAIIRVTSSAICGSDLHIYRGDYSVDDGTIIGHEFLGVIDEVGEHVTDFVPGERVLVHPGFRCGVCEACLKGLPIGCAKGGIFGNPTAEGSLNGGQAEYVRVPLAQKIMHRIPDGMSDEDVMLVTDMLPTGYFAAENGEIKPGDTVAVFGCGPVGLCAQICAQLFGPSKVFAVDLLEYRLKMAEQLGSIPIDASKGDAPTRIRELTDGLGVNVAIEAIGTPATFYGCLQAARLTSNISIVGIFSEPVELFMQTLCITNKKITMGLPHKLAEYIPMLLELIRAGRINARPLITHILPLSEGERAYEIFDQKLDGALKVVLKPGA